jgi:hypothetical protein
LENRLVSQTFFTDLLHYLLHYLFKHIEGNIKFFERQTPAFPGYCISAKRHGKPGVATLCVTIVPKSTPENFETSIG